MDLVTTLDEAYRLKLTDKADLICASCRTRRTMNVGRIRFILKQGPWRCIKCSPAMKRYAESLKKEDRLIDQVHVMTCTGCGGTKQIKHSAYNIWKAKEKSYECLACIGKRLHQPTAPHNRATAQRFTVTCVCGAAGTVCYNKWTNHYKREPWVCRSCSNRAARRDPKNNGAWVEATLAATRISTFQAHCYQLLRAIGAAVTEEGPGTAVGEWVMDGLVEAGGRKWWLECQGSFWHRDKEDTDSRKRDEVVARTGHGWLEVHEEEYRASTTLLRYHLAKELSIQLPAIPIILNADHFPTACAYATRDNATTLVRAGLFPIYEWEAARRPGVAASLRIVRDGKASRVFARDCLVQPVGHAVAEEFMNASHLHGFRAATSHVALINRGRVVMVLSLVIKDNHAVVERMASALGMVVVGGASKLFAYAVKSGIRSFFTYADKRFGGAVYEKCGFRKVRETNPGYGYVRDGTWYPRHHFQKHKLADLLETFDPSDTEYNNMRENGYARVWDAGNIAYARDT